MPFRLLLLGVVIVLLSPQAYAVTLWAGSSCTLTTIQAAVDAAAASGDSDNVIHLIANESYPERVQVAGLNVTVEGASAGCGSLFNVVGATSTFEGAGGADTSLLTISGNSTVVLGDVVFENAHALSGIGAGGGINFVGSGSLTLINVAVILNTAIGGGGINADAEGGTLDVFINEGTQILNNTAQSASGGGVQLFGATTLHMVEPDTWIALNHAPNGYGGGLHIVAPATALIGSPGFHGAPALYANRAAYGGGAAVMGSSTCPDLSHARLFLYTTDPENPIRVSDNVATVSGGGVYLLPEDDGHPLCDAELNAHDFVIEDNLASEGAGMTLDEATAQGFVDHGSSALLNVGARPTGAVGCGVDVRCNEISGNVDEDQNGQATLGATIFVGTSSIFQADALAMHHNIANFLMHAAGDNDLEGGISLHNCLTGGNNIARELIKMDGDDNPVVIDQCTLAPDIINSQYVIRFDNTSGNVLTISNTIIDEPGTLSLFNPGIDLFVDYVLTNDTSTLPTQVDVVLGEPDYVDLANGDYHQTATSLGVDFAPAAGGVDLDGNPRDVDLPVANFFGARDLGAYETQRTFSCGAADTIFCDGFEL